MKRYLFIIFLISTVKVFCQQQIPLNEKHYLDSLDHLLHSGAADSTKANVNFLLVDYWKFKDTLKSKTYLLQGTLLAQKFPYYKALSNFYEGQYYFNWNPARAGVAFKKAAAELAVFPNKRAYGNRAAAWFNYALMNKDKEGYEFITRITLNQVIPEAEKAGNLVMLAHYYGQLSTIFMNNYQFEKAAQYDQKAIALLERESPQSSTLLFAYLSGVSIYCYENKAELAQPLLKKAAALLKPFPESLNYTLYYYNESLYFSTARRFDQSLSSIAKGLALADNYHQKQLYQQFIFRKYDVYSHQQKYAKARQILLDIVKDGTLTAAINDKAEIYGELAKTNQQLHHYKEALQWLSRQREINDTISKRQTTVRISELEAKFRNAENQQKIKTLQAQNRQAKLSSKNQHLYNLMLAVGCLSLLIILGSVIANARVRHQFARQKEMNFQQQLKEMEQQEQLNVAKAMLDGEELERERVARDLHDGLGGMLAGVRIGLSGWTNSNALIAEDRDLHRVIGQLDTSVGELRRIARNMVPETLLKFGLEVALKDLSEFHMRDDLHIDFQPLNVSAQLPPGVQLHIYRIAQELVSNAVRHAEASYILLQASQNEAIFYITIEDDGIGFDPLQLKDKKGLGLENLKNRVAFLGGSFELQSAPGEGTTIHIELNTNGAR